MATVKARVRPTKKAREKAKATATAAVRKLQAKKAPPPVVLVATPVDVEAAAPVLRELIEVVEEANGQRVIPGAGPARNVGDERPGDRTEYVMTLRLTRRDARIMRVIAALGGYAYPATWAIETLREAMTRELAR